VSLNVTVFNIVGQGGNAVFQVGPTSNPTTAWINYPSGQSQIGNAGVMPLTAAGTLFFRVEQGGGTIDFTVDVNGYYGSPTSSPSNVFLGQQAGNTTMTGYNNTAVGLAALLNDTTGGGNTAIGAGALSVNTTANNNTAIGGSALAENTAGAANTATGGSALLHNTTGNVNVANGAAALLNNTTGSDNIAIGNSAGSNLTTGNDSIDIGNPGMAGESATIRMGTSGTHTRAFLAGVRGVTTGLNDAVAVMIDSAGQLGTVSSSRRFKQDIADMGDASLGLMRLRPVTFRYPASLDPTGSRQYGLIAEEVAEAFPDLAVFDKDGRSETVRYHVLIPMLLNEVQKDRRTIADLASRLERLEVLVNGTQ
jgi:hypothetical protein